MRRTKRNTLWERLLPFLQERSVGRYSYGELAAQFNTSARGVGSAMRALGKRGYGQLCRKVTFIREIRANIEADAFV